MAKISLSINGQTKEVDVDPHMPLLWTIRDYVWHKRKVRM